MVIMVNLQPGRSNAGLLQVASQLAASLDASVIGVAAWQPMPIDWSGGDYDPLDCSGQQRAAADAAIGSAEAEFRALFPGPQPQWCAAVSFAEPSGYIVSQVRRADLVLTGTPPSNGSDDVRAVAGDLVMQCGRPVLVVPNVPMTHSLDQVMLAWKETPEARRAALDALPLLQQAARVTVVEVAAHEDLPAARHHLEDVSHWLAKHGVSAETQAAVAQHDNAEQLDALAYKLGANLVVAGAYGHSRIREWAFGGVTRTLLEGGKRCALLSH